MKNRATDIGRIVEWLDRTLETKQFDDISNNGVQIACSRKATDTVAFAVDASVRAMEEAAAVGAGLVVVHHGISWGGGIRRIEGGLYRVVKAAMAADLAVYACHLPIDAHPKLGNNARLAQRLGLVAAKPAFVYHGETIGLVARASRATAAALAELAASAPRQPSGAVALRSGDLVGVCSGGAGEFAEEAQRLGCRVYITGEANWGEEVAAANCGMPIVCLGHYETEVWGVRAVARAMAAALKVKTVDLTEVLK